MSYLSSPEPPLDFYTMEDISPTFCLITYLWGTIEVCSVKTWHASKLFFFYSLALYPAYGGLWQ